MPTHHQDPDAPISPPTERPLLAPGELAQRADVSVATLHFYEREGLIEAERTSGNQRRYRRETLRRLAFIRFSQRLGISLEAIREALATLPADTVPTREDWADLSAAWAPDLDARIARLQSLRDHLGDCIGCGCLSLTACGVYNTDDHLGSTGTGPRRYLTD